MQPSKAVVPLHVKGSPLVGRRRGGWGRLASLALALGAVAYVSMWRRRRAARPEPIYQWMKRRSRTNRAFRKLHRGSKV